MSSRVAGALVLTLPFVGACGCATVSESGSGESGSSVNRVDSEAQAGNRAADSARLSASSSPVTTDANPGAGQVAPGKVSVPEGFKFQAAKDEELPGCPEGAPAPTYPGGVWSVADLRCAKKRVGDNPFKLRGTIVLVDRCQCDEGVVCGPCVDVHWIADGLDTGPYVLIQAKHAEEWQLGAQVELQLKAYRWETSPLPVASTNWVE